MRVLANLLLSLLILCTSAQLVGAQTADKIARLAHAPVIDGTLNDPQWQRATVYTVFKTTKPEPNREPAERTEVYFAFDHANLYVGIRSLDSQPNGIRAEATVPDRAWGDDWVAFALDTHDDGLDSFFFLVTPRGLRVAGTLDGNGDPTSTGALRWTSAATRTPEGYIVEMAIPIAQLPFHSARSVKMAFRVVRHINRTSQEANFPGVPESSAAGGRFHQFELTGIDHSRSPDELPLFNVREAYKEKLRLSAQFDVATLSGRVNAWGDASVLDYLIFPSRPLDRSRTPFFFKRGSREAEVVSHLELLEYSPGRPIRNLNRFLSRSQTTSFIVIKNDTILYERYFNGNERNSIATSFSVAKSFVSTLVGIAVDKGLIKSVTDPITKYLPELAQRDPRFSRITIKDLLRMSSGLRYVEGESPRDEQRTYMDPKLRQAALGSTSIVDTPGAHWLYNNYNPLLLGMILERASGRTVTELLQTNLWTPLGMEYGGSWSLDSPEDGFEKMESGINARAIDFAKFGRLLLNKGRWGGRQIVSQGWVKDASQPWPSPTGYYGKSAPSHYYGYMIWGDRRERGDSDFYAIGNKGQFIYCSPQRRMIIVRTGIQYGVSSATWLRLFRQLADQL